MKLAFTVYGEPQPAGSKRAFHKPGMRFPVVVDANPKAKIWREQVAREAARAMAGAPLLTGPLRLELVCYRPRPRTHLRANGWLRASAPTHPITRPDTTKILRGLEDSLTGICWRDDSQVCEQHAIKLYGEPARVEVRVEPLSLEMPVLHLPDIA